MTEPGSKNLNFLSLEDSTFDFELIRRILVKWRPGINLQRVDTETDFLEAISSCAFDIILADFNLPGFNGFEALDQALKVCPATPFIVVSGQIGEETAIELIKKGAVDYVLKDKPERLLFVVQRALDEATVKKARLEAEEALMESEIHFRTLADSGQALVWTSGPDMKCNYFNKPWLDFTGSPIEQELGDGWTRGIHPDDLRMCLDTYEIAYRNHEKFSIEFRLRHVSGEYRWVLDDGSPRYGSKGDFLGYIGHCLDITRQKETEDIIKESEDRYRTIFEHSLVPMWEMDLSELKAYFDRLSEEGIPNFRTFFRKNPSKVIFCTSLFRTRNMNHAALKFFGLKSVTSVFTQFPAGFFSGSMPIVTEEVISLAEGKSEIFGNISIKLSSGDIRYIFTQISVLPGSHETLGRVLISWIDISDRVQYEKMLRKKSEELRELVKHVEFMIERERKAISLNLHDDLGQKLTVLKMDLQWLGTRITPLKPEVEKKIGVMRNLIDDTVATVQKISSDLRPSILYDFGLPDALKWHLKEFSKRSGIQSNLKMLPPDPEVSENISIVIYRIVQEAVTNVARHSRASKVWVNLNVKKSNIHLIIKDNGIGIAPDKINNPESFGLMGIRDRVRTYEGDLDIRGSEGEGTTLTVQIPIAGVPEK